MGLAGGIYKIVGLLCHTQEGWNSLNLDTVPSYSHVQEAWCLRLIARSILVGGHATANKITGFCACS